ncbi:MAG: PKD repeat protein [Paraglaciecola sp.]|jgi:PKD repeat protein
MNRHSLLFILCFFIQNGFAQTSISGIVNTYTVVTNIKYCENEFDVNSSLGFEPDDFVIIMQMQGANIQNGDNSSFGDIDDLGSAGLFEKAEILSVIGNEITFKNLLVNEYNLDGSVQLISLPKYENATVDNPLTGFTWDGFTGGVIAIEVENTLTLNANIIATGIGFRGGALDIVSSDCNFLTNANDYFYDSNNWRGAPKGEGVAKFIAGKEHGRGAQANGGGGGNDHNTGGGGGSNLTNGGQGGEQDAPGTFGCSGNNPGVGGKGVVLLENRVFMGGGGGGGHADNNNTGSSGGNGGGIIIVIANSIMAGNNQLITNGLTPTLASGDGGGGGGAGGSIFLLAQNILGVVEVEADGGDGGDTVNPTDRCFGPGGGGSGGRIWTSATPGSTSLMGGMSGTNSTNSSECSGLSNGATDGQEGSSGSLSSIAQGEEEVLGTMILTQPNSAAICTGDDYQIAAEITGNNLTFQWQMDAGSGFVGIQNGLNFSGVNTANLEIQNAAADFDGNQFQLIVMDNCGDDQFTIPITIDIGEETITDFSVTDLGGGIFQFTNLSANFNSLLWGFGDSNMSTSSNPTNTYDEGNYTVTLTAFGDCDTVSVSQMLSVTAVPTAAFSFETDGDCAPVVVQFTNESSENGDSYTWMFDGGLPALSSMENPTVTYNTGGTFDVTLIVFNAEGSDTLTQTGGIIVQEFPTVNFSFMNSGLTVSFTNLTQNFNGTLLWDFGNNMTSNLLNPTHTYATAGVYSVTLIAENDCGVVTETQEVATGSLPIAAFGSSFSSDCVPFNAFFTNQSGGPDISSWFWEFPGGNPVTSTEENPEVTYSTPGLYDVTLTVTNSLGENTTVSADHVVANAFPNANFEYEIDDNTVIFMNTSVGGNVFTWDYGDGSPTTNELNPTHTFTSGGIFNVILVASNLSCANVQSEELFIDFSAAEEIFGNIILDVYPNPATDFLTVDISENNREAFKIRLFDLTGKMWRTAVLNNGKVKLEVSELAAGVYFLELIGEEGRVVKRILKN